MKKLIAAALTCIFLTLPALAVPVMGGGGVRPQTPAGVPADFDYHGSVVTSVTGDDVLHPSFVMDTPLDDGSFTGLHSYLDPLRVKALVEKDGVTYSAKLSVEWDYSSLDCRTAGEQTMSGTAVLPEGASLKEGVDVSGSFTVRICAPDTPEKSDAVILESVVPTDERTATAVERGTAAEALTDLLRTKKKTIACLDGGGAQVELPLEWDLSNVNLETTGSYTAVGRPVLPEGTQFADGFRPTVLYTILVQEAGKPDIGISCFTAAGNFFPWVTPPCDLADVHFRMKHSSDSVWEELTDEVEICADGILLKRTLDADEFYDFQASYPGGQTSLLSTVVDMEGGLLLIGTVAGDRDGGDSEGIPPVTVTPPEEEPVLVLPPALTGEGKEQTSEDPPVPDAILPPVQPETIESLTEALRKFGDRVALLPDSRVPMAEKPEDRLLPARVSFPPVGKETSEKAAVAVEAAKETAKKTDKQTRTSASRIRKSTNAEENASAAPRTEISEMLPVLLALLIAGLAGAIVHDWRRRT